MVNSVFSNYPLISALIAMLIAQVSKFFYYFIKDKRMDFRYLVLAGGMPSSHSAMAIALSTAVGLQEGWGSSVFAVSVIFASIVLYDAAGVRRAAGKQAKVLNVIMSDLFDYGKFHGEKLKELIGHTPLEVVAGFILGIIVAILLY
ncbi:MAG: divergent PAP2 family protein [Candidatus Margulisbacteria bacterium]|nr:divergent PAP2 family protein [Candidatus Margulisiibacteriota bacterium]